MFEKLKDPNSQFYRDYMQSFLIRSSYSSASIETANQDITDYNLALAVTGLSNAFNYLYSSHEEYKKSNLRFSPFDLPRIVEKVTNGEYGAFRTTKVIITGRDTELCPARLITNNLYVLFDDYYNVWDILDDPFLREAMFHIKFAKIHPFEDGNGRTIRLITSFNLLKNGIPPVIIPRERKSEYNKLIEDDNYDGLAKMFRELSKKEELIMHGIENNSKFEDSELSM